MRSYMANSASVEPRWYLVDAKGKILGRLATEIAHRLRGKHKPIFTSHTDTGDYIIVINADQIKVTGKKPQAKRYYRHSGYPGGLKVMNFEDLQQRHPGRVVELAVKGMLPKGPLGRAMFRKLKVYSGSEHPHAAQQPESLDI